MELAKQMLKQLFEYIKNAKSRINHSSGIIDTSCAEWRLLYEECLDFINEFGFEFDMSRLKKQIEKINVVSIADILVIERYLKSIERQIKLVNDINDKAEIKTKIQKPIKIFISHSSKDTECTKALVELLEGIGVEEKQIFCSSLREYGGKVGEDIYKRLKSEFNSYDLWVFFMLSDNYYSSPVSLNEMGAAWVLQKNYLFVLLPGFKFEDIKGAINPNKIGIQLSSSEIKLLLNDLKDEVCKAFDCQVSYNKWERIRDEFIDTIKDYQKDYEKNKLINTVLNLL